MHRNPSPANSLSEEVNSNQRNRELNPVHFLLLNAVQVLASRDPEQEPPDKLRRRELCPDLQAREKRREEQSLAERQQQSDEQTVALAGRSLESQVEGGLQVSGTGR